MRPHTLLITGSPGIGKTTVLCECATQLQDRSLGGFITEEIRGPRGRVGFRLRTFGGHQATLAHVEHPSRHRVSKYGVDVSALEGILESAFPPEAELTLVDEIGKMECFSNLFVDKMTELLDSEEPLVATVALRGGGFIEGVKRRTDVELWQVTRENRDLMPEQVLAWLGRSETV